MARRNRGFGGTNYMLLEQKIINKKEKIAVIGLGYVGMPLAVAFAKHVKVIGFDINQEKIMAYRQGFDPTKEVGDKMIAETEVEFTSDASRLKDAKFFIITVPTPINADKTPDLTPVIQASRMIGRSISKGAVIVYESTVYPGVTEEICIPILEEESKLICGKDFKVGYSPERVNPGDKEHPLENIKKIVSGIDKEAVNTIAKVYEIVIKAGVHKVSTIKVAEAAKVVENSQRDINIAFMNELAMVFDRMGIDTKEVIEAMNTKWNALGFYPGLVGGHCIGVDPYYFIYEAEKLGYHSQIILSGRKINDGMAKFVVDAIIEKLILANKIVRQAKVVIMGATFKEDCPDIRNSKVEDIVKHLKKYGIKPVIVDPIADEKELKSIYGNAMEVLEEIKEVDCLVIAVAHSQFKKLTMTDMDKMFKKIPNKERVIIDIKGIYNKKEIENLGYIYWRL